MIQKTQVPEKGLLQVLIGGKGDAAQAENPVEAGVDAASQTPEDFAAALTQAQDQKDAKTAGQAQIAKAKTKTVTRTKDGKAATAKTTENGAEKPEKSEETGKAQIQAQTQAQTQLQAQVQAQAQAAAQAAAQAQSELLTAAQGQAQAQTQLQQQRQAKMEAQGPKGPTLVQTQAQAQVQAQAQAKAQATAEEAALAAKGVRGGTKGGSLAGGVPGSDPALSEAVIAAQQAAMASQRAALSAQEATIKAHEAVLAGQQAQGNATVLQPIVIQTPLAIPVEVLEVEDDEAGAGGAISPAVGGLGAGAQRSMVASQDFLAQLRAGGPVTPTKSGAFEHEEHQKSSQDDRDGSVTMMMPALGGHHIPAQQAGMATATVPLEIGSARDGRTDVADAAALARQVSGLAARGGGAIRMRVMPESLGELTIHVKNESGKIDVNIEAKSHEAREALSAAMPELRQILTNSRFEVGKLEVGGRSAGGALAIARDGNGVGMSSWSTQSAFSDWQGGGSSQFGQDGQHAPNAWERYFDQQEGRRQQREQRAFQRYQEAMGS